MVVVKMPLMHMSPTKNVPICYISGQSCAKGDGQRPFLPLFASICPFLCEIGVDPDLQSGYPDLTTRIGDPSSVVWYYNFTFPSDEIVGLITVLVRVSFLEIAFRKVVE